MRKLNVQIPKSQWGTLKTKYPNHSDLVDYSELTGSSKNFDTTVNGSVTKRLGGVNYNPTTFTGPIKDQYEAIFSDGVRHLLVVANGVLKYSSGGGTFTDVTSGYSTLGNFEFTIYQDRVYFGNGIDSNQVYDRTASYGGVGYTVPQTKVMGAQAPSSAPSVAVAVGGNVPTGAHTYKITFLYYDLEESNGGPASAVATTTVGNQTVNLTSIPIGGYGVTARKIYRDNNDGVYLLVGTVSNNTGTTFSDTVSTGTAAIPTANNTPSSFKYIVTHLDRNIIAGIPGDPSALMFSEAGLPNIFPAANRILCNPKDPITALFVYNDTVYVFNRNSIGKILGRTKDTFRYSEIPASVGCVDNRSIQIRTVAGIPTLLWLSDKGMYASNGSSVEYISDPIEDLVNLNIQQASQVKGQNAQTSQSQFDGGTKTPAILTTGGTITVANPQRVWNDEADWEGGASLTNVATNLNNELSVPTYLDPDFNDGSYSNTVKISGTLRTPVSDDFTGESFTSFAGSTLSATTTMSRLAQPIVAARAGNITSITGRVFVNTGNSFRFKIYSDSGAQPGGVMFDSGIIVGTTGVTLYTAPCSVALTAGQRVWISVEANSPSNLNGTDLTAGIGLGINFNNGNLEPLAFNGSSWVDPGNSLVGEIKRFACEYVFSSTGLATSGTWTGPVYDSLSDSAVAGNVAHTGTFAAGTSSITTVEASNVSDFSSGVISQAFNNLNGMSAVSLSNKRYWRIKIQLSATDDRLTAQIGSVTMTFSTTGTWISEAIDHTTDITALSSLTVASTVPSGTTVTTEIATSADNMTYTSFTAIGSATPQRYSKVRIIMTTNAGNTVTPVVTSVTLNWAISANIISSAIDTGATPAGWDIFQSQFATNGGTVVFHMRSAATLGGLTAATFVAVTNGAFPAVTANPFVQWRATLTATAGNVPTVDSVTVNWFISTTASIRVASLFYNRSYYLAAAEYNQTANNIMIVLDGEGKWRIYRGISAATMSFFFNDPYYGSSTAGQIVRFLQGQTDQGANIELILDTKSMNFGDEYHTKILRKVYLTGTNTGATYTVQFSVDGGTTFYTMLDVNTGNSSYTTSSDNGTFRRRFQPNFTLGNVTSGKEILIRVKENTSNMAQIDGIQAEAWVRAGELV